MSLIMAMEAYLLDNFLSALNSDKAVFRKYIETTDHFRGQKILLSTIFKESDGIDKRGRAYLTKMLWHRLSDVARLYRNTLGVQLPQDMKELLAAVQIRHDFVHRNGRTPDGKEISLTPGQITDLVKLVQNLVDGIEAQQQELSEKAKVSQQSPNDRGPDASDNTVDLDPPKTPNNK